MRQEEGGCSGYSGERVIRGVCGGFKVGSVGTKSGLEGQAGTVLGRSGVCLQ